MRPILALALAGLVAASSAALAQFAPWQPMTWKPSTVAPAGTSCAASITSSASGADVMTATATVINSLTCQ